jgi:hypothetical protein
MSDFFKMDVCTTGKYKVELELANLGPDAWQRLGGIATTEHETIEDVICFIYEHTKCLDNGLRKSDAEQEHGTIANTNFYKVIKGYRDTPDCYLF